MQAAIEEIWNDPESEFHELLSCFVFLNDMQREEVAAKALGVEVKAFQSWVEGTARPDEEELERLIESAYQLEPEWMDEGKANWLRQAYRRACGMPLPEVKDEVVAPDFPKPEATVGQQDASLLLEDVMAPTTQVTAPEPAIPKLIRPRKNQVPPEPSPRKIWEESLQREVLICFGALQAEAHINLPYSQASLFHELSTVMQTLPNAPRLGLHYKEFIDILDDPANAKTVVVQAFDKLMGRRSGQVAEVWAAVQKRLGASGFAEAIANAPFPQEERHIPKPKTRQKERRKTDAAAIQEEPRRHLSVEEALRRRRKVRDITIG